jgi:methyl-accepting chemotaxis protein
MKLKISLKKKLLILIVFSGMSISVVSSLLAYLNNKRSLEDAAKDKFNLIMSGKAEELEKKLKDIGSSVKFFAQSITTVEAMKEFSIAFQIAANQLVNKVQYDQAIVKLEKYYSGPFEAKFNELNPGREAFNYETLGKGYSEVTKLMQYAYIANNEFPLGEKNKLSKSKFDIAYDKVHERYHATMSKYLEEYKFYDAFLVDLDGNVIYSVYKELDFATNLKNNFISKSGLAEAYRKALTIGDSGEVAMVDLAPYAVSYNVAASFVSYPIKDNDNKMIGVAILQVDTNVLNSIVSFDKKWSEVGLGKTGQSFVIGNDLFLRTPTREIVEVEMQDSYFKKLSGFGYNQTILDEMKAKSTNALLYQFNSEQMKQVVKSKKSGFVEHDDEGKTYFMAYRPLRVFGVDWQIITKQEKDEILFALKDLEKMILLQMIIFSLALFFVGFWFSKSLSTELSKVVNNLSAGSTRLLSTSHNMAQSAKSLSESTNDLAASLQETVASVDEISAMVKKNSDAAESSTEVSRMSKEAAQNGKATVAEMVSAIDQIHQSNVEITTEMERNSSEMQEIVKVIAEISSKTKVINDIVFQTKLLSFNASVEAARAGENGKGFAVVAQEVGNLAQMSGKAANEIEQMIALSIKKVETIANDTGVKVEKLIIQAKEKIDQGSRVANQCNLALTSIIENVDKVNELVNEISVASKEQTQGIHEISKAMGQMDEVTQQNASVAQGSSKSSEELNFEAMAVKDIAQNLDILVNGGTGQLSKIENQVVDEKKEVRHREPSNLIKLPSAKKIDKEVESELSGLPDQDDPRFKDV